MQACNYGLRVAGGKFERRAVVDAPAALLAYCSCDPAAEIDRESYLSAFWFTKNLQDYFSENGGSEKGYGGVCWQPYQNWDIDNADIDQALTSARRLATVICERYKIDEDGLLIFFSGSKGFHICLETSLWLPEPSEDYHRIARAYAETITKLAGVQIDTGIYNQVRLWRAPNSKHPKSGLRKRRLTYAELMGLRIERIAELAKEPLPFDEVLCGFGVCDQAVADWRAAQDAVRQQGEEAGHKHGSQAPRINKLTRGIITGDPILEGDRHRLLFSAAANCAEFGSLDSLVYGLLTEAGINSGLSPSEVAKQLSDGIAHGRRKA